MAGPAVAKYSGIPCCTICLVIAALTCHSLVLVGNLRIAALIHAMGDSVHGWSGRGLVLADSLTTDVDHVMARITDGLTNTTRIVLDLQSTVDEVIANIGDRTDDESFLSEMLDADRLCKEEVEDKLSSANMLQTVVQVMKGGDLQPLDRSDVPAELAPEVIVGRAKIAREATCTAHWRKYMVKLPSSDQSVGGDAVRRVVKREVEILHVLIDQLMTYLRPVLEQIGKWLVTFGDKLQSVLESLSTTIDKVQKIFDDIAALAGNGDEEQMIYDTITILNTDGQGNISVTDLINASSFYGIECLQPKNAERMMKAHDKDGDGELNEKEYHTFVRDDAVPNVMGVALREYAKRLSAISGTVASAKLRDEVAHAVVDYFSLVCAKNMSKVQWVSDRLTNGSLPLAFTSDILKDLAQNKGNPNIRTTADVGHVIIKEMMRLNESYVLDAYRQMADPEFWASEGFPMADQPDAVKKVSKWIEEIQAEEGFGTSLLEWMKESIASHASHPMLLQVEGSALHVRAAALVKAKGRARVNARVAQRAKRRQELLRTRTGRLLFARLIQEPQSSDVDPELERIINAGVPAVPATLEFAQFLAWNASSTANRFQKQSADYMSSSTNPLQSFSNDIRGMINKIIGFIESMERYASPDGIKHIEALVQKFLDNAVDEMTSVLVMHHGHRATSMMQGSNETYAQPALLRASEDDVLGELPEDVVDEIRGAWDQLNGLLTTLTSMMPTVVDNIIFARTQVGAVSEAVTSIFGTMDDSMPELFYMAARYYKMGWTAYFTLFALLTVGLLVYGFWAAGFMGNAEKVDGYVPPQTFAARCAACCNCCGSCMRSCHDGYIACWALVITGEIVALLLFIVAIVLSILAGVQYFIASGCSMVYLLGDNAVCGGILNVVDTFLESFLNQGTPGSDTCYEEKLTACGMMAEKMSAAVIFIVIGSFASSIVTLELIVDAAVNHERAIWRKRILDETAYDGDEAAAAEADPKKAD